MYIKPEDIIIRADDDMVVINKPSGLLTLPDRYDSSKPYVQKVLEPKLGKLWIVHRLDKETSGILVLARTSDMHQQLSMLFENRKVNKIYHALVYGIPEWTEKVVNSPLLTDGDRNHRTIIHNEKGKPSQTQFRVLEKFINTTLIEASPKTGYTHQIRVHLASCGLPILMDELYGNRTINKRFPIKRLFLHAYCINFIHPKNLKEVSFFAEYQKELVKAIRRCKNRKI